MPKNRVKKKPIQPPPRAGSSTEDLNDGSYRRRARGKHRIVYCPDLLYELKREDCIGEFDSNDPPRRAQDKSELQAEIIPAGGKSEIDVEVEEALKALPSEEQEVIRAFYYQGLSRPEIAKELQITPGKVIRLKKRAERHLKAQLVQFLAQRFPAIARRLRFCVICLHPERDEIERVLASKTEEESWKRVLRELKAKFGLPIKAPRVVITHQQLHQLPSARSRQVVDSTLRVVK